MSSIPTANNPKMLELKGGGSVLVKRIRKQSRLTRITELAKVKDGDEASQMRRSALLLRCGIVGCSGLTDVEDGTPVEWQTENHATLGVIASEDVSDAIADVSDVVLVIAEITGQRPEDVARESGIDPSELSPEQSKN